MNQGFEDWVVKINLICIDYGAKNYIRIVIVTISEIILSPYVEKWKNYLIQPICKVTI